MFGRCRFGWLENGHIRPYTHRDRKGKSDIEPIPVTFSRPDPEFLIVSCVIQGRSHRGKYFFKENSDKPVRGVLLLYEKLSDPDYHSA